MYVRCQTSIKKDAAVEKAAEVGQGAEVESEPSVVKCLLLDTDIDVTAVPAWFLKSGADEVKVVRARGFTQKATAVFNGAIGRITQKPHRGGDTHAWMKISFRQYAITHKADLRKGVYEAMLKNMCLEVLPFEEYTPEVEENVCVVYTVVTCFSSDLPYLLRL